MSASSKKTVAFKVTESDLFCLFIHFSQNVMCGNAREQDEYETLWHSLHFEEIKAKARRIGADATEDDFDGARELECELDRQEIVAFVKFCSRPCRGPLAMVVRKIRLAVIEARDTKGLRAIGEDEEPDAGPGPA